MRSDIMGKSWDIENYEKISQRYSQELEVMFSYYKKIVYILMKQGLTHEDAQDAAQDAYIEAIACLPKLKKREAVISWLITIATRVGDKYLAKKIKMNDREVEFETCRESEILAFPGAHSNEDKIEDALGISKKEILRQNMSKLGTVERKVLIMHYTYQYDYRYISAKLNINHSTVRTISKRAKEKLRRLIIEEELNNIT